jgi:hypothetical protein
LNFISGALTMSEEGISCEVVWAASIYQFAAARNVFIDIYTIDSTFLITPHAVSSLFISKSEFCRLQVLLNNYKFERGMDRLVY